MPMRFVALASLFLMAGVWACSGDEGAQRDLDEDAAVDAQAGFDADAGMTDTGVVDASSPDAKPDTGPVCDDPNDFGGREAARQLPSVTDQQDFHERSDILSSPSDVDRFAIYGDDESSFGFPSPYVIVGAMTPGLRLCAYLACTSGSFDSAPQCPTGSMADTDTVSGAPGCCFNAGSGSEQIEISYDCKGGDDDATLIVDVSSPSAMCTPYKFKYKFGD